MLFNRCNCHQHKFFNTCQILSHKEGILSDYILHFTVFNYGLTSNQTRKFACQYVIENNLKYSQNWTEKTAVIRIGFKKLLFMTCTVVIRDT